MAKAIPIFKFEPKVVNKLFGIMDEIDVLTFSFCSPEAKSLATSAKIPRLSVSIEITEEVRLQIQFFLSQYHIHLGNPSQGKPGSVGVKAQGSLDRLHWNMPNYTFKDWIAHVTEVLHCSISSIRVVGGHIPGIPLMAPVEVIEAVGDATKNMDIKDIMISGMVSDETADMVSSRLTNIRSIHLTNPGFESPIKLQKFANQNSDTLSIFMRRDRLQISLDNILATNSRQLFITSEIPLTEKLLNQFLKLWQNGANPRLEVFYLISPEDVFLNETEVFNGINHQVIPDEEERIFMKPVRGPDGRFEHEIYGGMDIRRKDGTLGTIILNEMHHFFQFYVWHKP